MRSLSFSVHRALHRLLGLVVTLRNILIALGTAGLGAFLGFGLVGPSRDFIVSIVVTIVYTVVILQRSLFGLILWVNTLPLIDLYINIPMGAGIPDVSLNRFCAFLFGLVFLCQHQLGEQSKTSITRLDKLALLSGLSMLVSVPSAVSPANAAQVVLDWYLLPAWVYFLVRHLVSDRQTLWMVLKAFVAAGAFAGTYAIYYTVTGNAMFVAGTYHGPVAYTNSLNQIVGLLDGPANFGLFFSMVIPLNVYLLLQSRELHHRVVYGITLGIMFVGIFLTYRRTSWIALVIAFFVLQWFYPRFRRLFFALLVVFALALFFTWDSVSESAVVTERVNAKVDSANGRTDIWNTMFNMWKDRPLIGFGYDQYKRVSGRYRTDGRAEPFQSTQSEYYTILVSAGLAGFVPYVLLMAQILLDSIRVFREAVDSFVDRQLVVTFWGVFIAFLIGGVTIAHNHAYPKMVFFAMAGIVAGHAARAELAKERTAGCSRRFGAPVA